ncbi:MAG TPA: radical SAM protein, partial [Bacteroidetes bacterium]|nr:radical SAM protein [Bacteroidota bacterium]
MRLDWNRSLQYIKRMTEFALYVHYPFCLSRCRYCGFASEVHDDAKAGHYHRALLKEMEDQTGKPPWCNGRPRSIYFGGGTPSLLSVGQLDAILSLVHRRYRIASDAEISLEANPATFGLDEARAWRALGINRVSLGVQSLDDSMLRTLGRLHT